MYTAAELVGGPRDGEIHALQEDLMVVKFAIMRDPEYIATEDPPQVMPVGVDYIQYLRTERRSAGGRRIYQYVPPKQGEQ